METKEIVITPPEGFEVDEENSTFKKIIFKKKKEFSSNWEEFCIKYPTKEGECYINTFSKISTLTPENSRNCFYKNYIPNKKLAEAFTALMQLITIREKEYTKGWEPDWKDVTTYKFVIYFETDIIDICNCRSISFPLSFPTKELAEKFLENWRDLIKIAKPLL